MAYEDDYLQQINLGSNTALKSAAPEAAPTASPTSSSPLALASGAMDVAGYALSQLNPDKIQVPDRYKPGSDTEDSQIYLNEFDRFRSMVRGEVPLGIRLRAAEQEIKLKEVQTAQAIANFHQTGLAITETMRQHDREAKIKGMELIQTAKDRINSTSDPDERTLATDFYVDYVNSFDPGLGDALRVMDKEPTKMLGLDAILGDPVYGKSLRSLLPKRGYAELVKDPEVQRVVESYGKDMIRAIAMKIPHEDMMKAIKGGLTQTEFVDLYEKVIASGESFNLKPIDIAFARAALNTEWGEVTMGGLNVTTDKMVSASKMKEKPADLIKARQNERFEKNEKLIAFAEENPGVIDAGKLKAAKEQNAISMGDLAKRSNTGENPNNRIIQRWKDETGHQYATVEDAVNSPDSPARTDALNKFNTAIASQDRASATAASAAREGEQQDLVTHPVYKMENGEIVPFRGELTKKAFKRGDGGWFVMSSDQQQRVGKMKVVKEGGQKLNALAEKAYSKNSAFWNVADETLMKSELTASIVAKNNPDLYAYVKQRDTVLGNYARALGGEVGVLTEQDILRVKNMFASPSSSAKTRAATYKAFNDLIKINEQAITSMLVRNNDTGDAGNLTPAQLESLKNDKAVRAQIEKVFSTVAGVNGSEMQKNAVPGSATSSTGKPDNRSRAERLIDEIGQ